MHLCSIFLSPFPFPAHPPTPSPPSPLPQEEREKQLEAMFEARAVALPTDARRPDGADDEEGGEGAEAAGLGGAAGELGGVGGAARGTQETVWAADSIIEAVELASMEEARMVPFIKAS
ncbi:unnamed protein product [Closterium sp. NIES-53]